MSGKKTRRAALEWIPRLRSGQALEGGCPHIFSLHGGSGCDLWGSDWRGVGAIERGPAGGQLQGPTTAAQQFKNIQVLKDIPADQLIPAMQFITASLGVECEFCHVQDAFEKDDKKTKVTARKMMEMMFTINQGKF